MGGEIRRSHLKNFDPPRTGVNCHRSVQLKDLVWAVHGEESGKNRSSSQSESFEHFRRSTDIGFEFGCYHMIVKEL
jgi:hypothetical protein